MFSYYGSACVHIYIYIYILLGTRFIQTIILDFTRAIGMDAGHKKPRKGTLSHVLYAANNVFELI